MNFVLVLALAYFLGSVPFGLLVTKWAGMGDIRQIGSGNFGTTNVLRTGKKSLALLTLLLDVLKGAAAVVIADYAYPSVAQFAGLAAILGHMFPLWLSFKGGKGVATSFGVLLILAWPVGLGAAVVWLGTAFFSRYSSLSALAATALSPLLAYVFGYRDVIWLLAVIAVLVFLKHKGNIRRLIDGTETKIGHYAATDA